MPGLTAVIAAGLRLRARLCAVVHLVMTDQETLSLDTLWAGTPAGERVFDGAARFPEPARRYLVHAMAPNTQLANAVRLRMHGEIKLGAWRPFEAEQVISRTRGLIWTARTRLFGVPVSGFDRFIDGEGEMRWKLFGAIPFMTASGPDITRSAAGRLAGESMWLPSMLCDPSVAWEAADASHPTGHLAFAGHAVPVTLTIGSHGEIQQTAMPRWGNPNREPFAERPFGGVVEAERTFDGYTIPSRVRVGWYFGTERFERDGEFFRCTIDEAAFR